LRLPFGANDKECSEVSHLAGMILPLFDEMKLVFTAFYLILSRLVRYRVLGLFRLGSLTLHE